MIRHLAITLAFATLLASVASAQPGYTRTSFTEAYVPISVGGGATAISFADNDDGTTSIPLPFDFTYAGTSFGTSNFLAVCTNGYVFPSTSAVTTPTSELNSDLYTSSAPNNTLAPWWDDLSIAAVGTNPPGSVLYQTQGTPGSQTLTVQWTAASSYFSTTFGSPRIINFQLVLYEGTNVVEFRYGGVSGSSYNTDESASIGIEDATGGNNHYIDAVTGSSQTSNGMLTTNKWPQRFFRFTPGAPTPLAGGTYSVGSGGSYPGLSEAVADLNHRGISGAVTLQLTDAVLDSTSNTFPILLGPIAGTAPGSPVVIEPVSGTATLIHTGTRAGGCGNAASPSVIGTSNEPAFGLVGADYVSVRNLSLNSNGSSVLDRGILVINSSPTDGAQNNTFTGVSITLNRSNTGSVALQQNTVSAVTAASGQNDFNKYYNLMVSNAFAGIQLTGTASFPDAGCEVGTTSGGTTTIGGPGANDLGNGSGQTWGVRATSQSGVRIFNCEIRNLTSTSSGVVDGIFLDNAGSSSISVGTCEIFNNVVHGLNNTSTGAGVVSGLRVSLTGNGASVSRVYNNFVYDLSSASTAGALRRLFGIRVQDGGFGSGTTHNIDFNSVRLAPAGLACSNACLELGTATGPVMNIRNNVLANFSGAQSGSAQHFAFVTPAASTIGPAGSTSDRNVLYVDPAANGFLGLTSITTRAALPDWQAAVSQDANSLPFDPKYQAPTNLHISASAPTPVEALGSYFGGAITWVGNDIDNEARNPSQPDIGADEGAFVQLYTKDIAPAAFVDPLPGSSKLAGGSFTPQASFANLGITTQTNVPVRFRIVGPSPSTAEVYNRTQSISSLGVGATSTVNFPNTSISTLGTYTMYPRAELPGDQNVGNNEISNTFQVSGPLCGTYQVGSAQPAPFNTLTSAIALLNSVGVSCPVTFELTDALYSSSETFPITVQTVPGASAANTVRIKPAALTTPTISGSSGSAILVLNGTDYLTLDGSSTGGTSRDLTIINASPSTVSAVVWGQNNGSNGVTNCTLKNVNLQGSGNTQTLFCAGFGGSSISTISNGTDNDNNRIMNCSVQKSQYGLYSAGASAGNRNTGTVISQNVINTVLPNNVQVCGILVRFEDGVQITDNQISEINRTTTAYGISLGFQAGANLLTAIGDDVTNATVTGNRIGTVVSTNTTGYTAAGIAHCATTTGTSLIANNMITGVMSPAAPSDITVGIYHAGGSGGVTRIYFNSVSMTGSRGGATNPSYGIAVNGLNPVVDIRNNVVVNSQSSTADGRSYAIGLGYGAPYTNLTSNYNDFVTSGTSAGFAKIGDLGNSAGSERTSLAAWQTETGKDANSISADPLFLGVADLHISQAGTTPPVANAGTPLASIVTDIDGNGRSASTPDIGADEFVTNLLNITAAHGSVARNPDYPSYNPGTSVQLTATADSCYSFEGWQGDATGNANPLTVVMNSDKAITAVFPIVLYEFTASAGSGGSIAPSGAVNVGCGTSQTFTVTPAACYHITDVAVDGTSMGAVAGYTFTNVHTTHTISASFAFNDPSAITASAGTGGSISPSGSVSVTCGNDQAFAVTPVSCYHIADLVVDGTSRGALASYTFANVQANHTIAATFAQTVYTIAASAGTGGSISPSGAVSVTCGTAQAFSVTPAACYHIVDVVVDGSSVGTLASYTFANVQAAHTIAATFAQNVYTITASSGTGGSISPSGAVSVTCGTAQAFSVTPAACYHIADVVVDGTSRGAVASYTFSNVQANHTIAATFTFNNPYTITASSGTGGSISPSGAVSVTCGTNQVFTVTPAACYHIANVAVDGTSRGAVASYTFSNVQANHTIAAAFVQNVYTITASAGTGGSIAPSGAVSVTCGTAQTFTVTPAACYHIEDVVVDGTSRGAVASYTFSNVQTAHTIAATFAQNVYTITASAGTGGSISPSGAVSVTCGTAQTFTVTPAACYQIADLVVDGTSRGAVASYTFSNVQAAHTIAATFAQNVYTITASAGTGGSISPSGAVSVTCGTAQTFTVTPAACYHIADVVVDGTSRGALASYTFSNVQAAHTIAATFAQNVYTITASAGTGGSISPSGAVSVTCGTDQAFSLTPAACYRVADVVVDGTSVGAVASYTFSNVQAGHTIAATFAQNVYTITASAGTGGSISPSGAVSVTCGTDQAFSLTPAACYHVADVVVDGTSVGAVASYTFSNVQAAHTIATTFAQNVYTITASAGTGGSISPSGAVSVNCGSAQAFAVTPAACYHIADVVVDGSSVGTLASYTFANVQAAHTIAATFAQNVYTITATAGTGGSISPSGAVSVNCGTVQAFSVAAAACYHIADVVVDGTTVGAVASYTFSNVQAAHTIAATFAQNVYTITASAGTGGSISPSGAVSVTCGTAQAFSVTAAACYQIADVVVDGTSAGALASYTFSNVQAAHTIAATFAQNVYTITASAGTGGSISPSGAVSVTCGTAQAFSVAAAACYHIADVVVDGTSVGPLASYTFSNVQAAHTIAATFAQNVYTITASAGTGGSISPSGAVSVTCGIAQAFSVAATSCYHIADVVVDGTSRGAVASYTFSNVQANHTIAATFTFNIPYTITASAGTGGSISPSGAVSVTCGTDQAFTVPPAACYHIADVAVDGTSRGAVASYTFSNVQANHTIAATFTFNSPYTIAASAGTGGSISPSGAVSVNCGTAQTFTVTPAACYHIADVVVDAGSVGAVASYAFANVQAAHTIAATFAQNIYTITASAGTGGSISPSGAVSVACGTSQAFSMTPAACYHIADVVVDGTSRGAVANHTFGNVQANHTILATFAQNVYTITASAGTGGSISPSGAVSVTCGTGQAFTVTPAACYHIAGVVVDGTSRGAVASYTFANVQTNHTIAATFAQNVYSITASAGTGGSISPSGIVQVACGTDQSFQIVPDAAHHIADVVVDGISAGTAATYNFTGVQGAHTIAAVFAVTDTVRPVVEVLSPNGGEALIEGHTYEITWNSSDNVACVAADVLLSRTGPDGPFEALALAVPDSGSYSWVVTLPATTDAFVKVVGHDSSANAGFDVSNAPFTIVSSAVAVGSELPREFGLAAVYPNPTFGSARIAYDLPREARVRLTITDLQGRQLAVLEDGARTPGRYETTWDGRTRQGHAPPGVYFVRLELAGRGYTRRFAMAR